MALGIYLNESVWSSRWLGTIKSKTEGHEPTLEETRTDHTIRSSIAITKAP